MSSLIYFFADLYPWWGIPLAFIFAELANYYRRHGDRKKMVTFMSLAVVLMTIAVAYFFFNGMEHLRPAMQDLERNYFQK